MLRITVLLILSSFAATFGYRKSVTLTPLISTVDGATVNLLRDTTVNSNSDAWEIACTDTNRYWAIEISLDPSWGFHASLPSNITLRINSDTPTETDTDLDPILSFSVNRAQYWSTMVHADGTATVWDNKIGPQCDTNTPPQSGSLLFFGDVKDKVDSSDEGRYLSSGARIGTAGTPVEELAKWQPPSKIIYFPLQFKIENVPVDNLMYVYNIQETYTQKCGFAEAFTGEHGLQIYLHLDDAGEFMSVQSFEIQYEDGRTDDPSTANPTTIRPTTADPTSNPTIPPTTGNPTSVRPSTDNPTTSGPTTARPTTADPSTAAPSNNPTLFPSISTSTQTDEEQRMSTATRTTTSDSDAENPNQVQPEKSSTTGLTSQTLFTLAAVIGAVIVCLLCVVCFLVYKYVIPSREDAAYTRGGHRSEDSAVQAGLDGAASIEEMGTKSTQTGGVELQNVQMDNAQGLEPARVTANATGGKEPQISSPGFQEIGVTPGMDRKQGATLVTAGDQTRVHQETNGPDTYAEIFEAMHLFNARGAHMMAMPAVINTTDDHEEDDDDDDDLFGSYEQGTTDAGLERS